LYPDAFEKYLRFEDEQLQDIACQAAEDKKMIKNSEKEQKHLKYIILEQERKKNILAG
jgi:hypothetical protein